MLESIVLIILCNLLMYFIIMVIFRIKKIKSKKYSIKRNKDIGIEELNEKVNELEKKIFIQEILNHTNIESEINEKLYYVNQIIEKYKDESMGYYLRGNLYIKFEKYEEAIKDFDRSIKINNNYKEA